MKLPSLSFLLLLSFIACTPTSNNSSKVDDELSEQQKKTVQNAIAEAIEKSKTEEMPVYLTFDEFEPLIHQKDDKIRVINFWATWCKPCVAELPYFEQIHENYKDKNVEVMLVSLDNVKKLDSKVLPFVRERQLKSKLALLDDADYNSWIDKVSPEWSGSIPATLFYTKDKRIFLEQEFDYKEIEEVVKGFM